MPKKNYYEVLKVARNASQEEITAVYRELAKKWHPDKYLGLKEKDAAAKRFKFFQNAYDVLGNPEKRKRYDEKLLKHEATIRQTEEATVTPPASGETYETEADVRERREAEARKQREANEPYKMSDQELKLQEQYDRLVRAKDWKPTESEYQELAKKFWGLNGYKDSIALARHCEARYQSLKELREAREKKEPIAQRPTATGIETQKYRPMLYWISGVAVLVLVLIMVATAVVNRTPADQANAGIQLVQGDNPFEDPTVEWKTDNPFEAPAVELKTDNPFAANDSRKAAEPADPSTLIGKIMCGYQGWFHIEGDGSGMGNFHYGSSDFGPESYAHIDMWADMSEMDDDEKYPTRFRHADGSVAYVFSSTNRKTVARHFQWMEDYGIDGVFLQRFIGYARDLTNDEHVGHSFIGIMENVRYGAEKHNRAWAMMYDIGGARPGELMGLLVNDWKRLVDENKIRKDRMYLHHNGKPVISLWGIGLEDNRFTLQEALELITFLKDDSVYGGNTVKLGVPTYWRELKWDTVSDPLLHEIIRKADIVSPWSVGRFVLPEGAVHYTSKVANFDVEWCKANGVEYMPVVFPGGSWYNLMNSRGREAVSNESPRVKGKFLSTQIKGHMDNGVTMIYQAMFDEIDEGTAIFKVTNDPPVGGVNRFLDYEGLPSDFYLKLVGNAAKELKQRTRHLLDRNSRALKTDNPFAD